MDNTNIVLATNIQNFRKKCGFTQEELAQKIGVTFQAISKWENAKATPDISFLPVTAGGNIEAEIIKCNKVHCETLECESIDKNVSIK